ncbi:MAG: DUF3955 domain-containing protein [Moritella sp.]|uniref:DUF3955 domain-containing protein n=1 Tax=unclassified Moritella TaxID=2637987 RepID=UPI0001568809|nr:MULTISPECIES: DUF3955 domain-containing protein [unclassified Moritella]EDM68444.1 hypothetical protein PE36_03431 [Moritella sp. PE36]MBL1417153.1 DUF3955 domain-containing protein [Moritella sp.]PHR88883.1 MAG: DUF3955 domain-containing protein [Moritella sp.]
MNFFTNKALTLALISLGLGLIFIIAENIFYQFVDSDGVLHESMFMPLGVISITVGILFLLFFIIQKIRCSFHKK